ncbi:zinc finger CCHC domain-containing protein 7-like isoform X2 [Stegastes partitus]|uniref:Zinc finger CCHC domain-containing protein 7 n=1 Tax=Stegastes partitus TaxID=144197 RepID=A0A9Y4N394_9TELE|nr:PREDICTED: zinc finger CCHC domain-containing protein 7-like isoform X2 [Stegastes partitus]
MDFTQENEVNDGVEGARDDPFFIEDCTGPDGEGEIQLRCQKLHTSCKQAARLSREGSPPLLLAFSGSSGRSLQDASVAFNVDLLEEEEEDSDQSIEDWMILEEGEQAGDSSIQLNLNYLKSSEDDCGVEDEGMESVKDIWAVSEKDKYGDDQSVASRYFVPGQSLICHICNKTGHLAKSCFQKKRPPCVLCGIQGHLQRDCPGRPCHSCGLPSHGLRPCEIPPVWKQHCQRCGITGHLSDACPDTWRQYHFTIRLEVPLKPRTVHNLRHKSRRVYCYNCSKKGHYGYECSSRRMVSGTFPSLPYVCHYDTIDDILQCHTRKQKEAKELVNAGSLLPSDPEHLSEKTRESGEENLSVHGRSRTKREACSQAGRRKTWPERRRERREVKQLRRKAQAIREGGLLGRSHRNSSDEVCHTDPFRYTFHSHMQSTPTQTKGKSEISGRKSRKSREAERWKKRGGMKRGDLFSYVDLDIGSENLFSPKQRVRHRRK